MSSRGDCWDNAPCESWFGKLKSEWIDPQDAFATRQDAELAIVETIAMFDNGKQIHQALDYQTPNACEAKYFDTPLELTAKSKGVDRKGKGTGLRRCDEVKFGDPVKWKQALLRSLCCWKQAGARDHRGEDASRHRQKTATPVSQKAMLFSQKQRQIPISLKNRASRSP
jgi:hypothetical protein